MGSYIWLLRSPTRAIYPAVAIFLAGLLSSCTNHSQEVLAQACVRAALTADSNGGQALNSRCQCAATAAQKYLDPDDYKLLVGAANIYSSHDPDSVKFGKLVDGMVASGLTVTKATVAATDMMFLAHKVAGECGNGDRSSV